MIPVPLRFLNSSHRSKIGLYQACLTCLLCARTKPSTTCTTDSDGKSPSDSPGGGTCRPQWQSSPLAWAPARADGGEGACGRHERPPWWGPGRSLPAAAAGGGSRRRECDPTLQPGYKKRCLGCIRRQQPLLVTGAIEEELSGFAAPASSAPGPSNGLDSRLHAPGVPKNCDPVQPSSILVSASLHGQEMFTSFWHCRYVSRMLS